MQLFCDTFFPPASFTFFTVLTCSLLFAGKNGSQLFFSFLFLVSTALTFAAGFTQTLSIPFMRWRAVQESGIMCITVSCCGSLLLTCFPLLWHGFLHMLQSLWGCPHLCVGCPRAAAPQGCCCPGTFCHNHSPLRVGGTPIPPLAQSASCQEHAFSLVPATSFSTSPPCFSRVLSISAPPSRWCPFFNMFAWRHPVLLQQLQF